MTVLRAKFASWQAVPSGAAFFWDAGVLGKGVFLCCVLQHFAACWSSFPGLLNVPVGGCGFVSGGRWAYLPYFTRLSFAGMG